MANINPLTVATDYICLLQVLLAYCIWALNMLKIKHDSISKNLKVVDLYFVKSE